MKKFTVDCVIVTFNKVEMLKKSIAAIDDQTYEVKNIFVINNASSDGTQDYLNNEKEVNPKLKVLNLKENLGGAGGFNYGLRKFVEDSDSDFVWIIDDDALAEKSALLNMIEVFKEYPNERIGFVASNVRWTDGKPAYMNIPYPSDDWTMYANNGVIKIKSTSFVSMLVTRDAIKEVGLPISDFFIWGDDVEFSYRITSAGYTGLFVSNSIVTHFMDKNVGINLLEEVNPNRVDRYFYEYRNSLYNIRTKRGNLGVCKELVKRIILVFKILFSNNDIKYRKVRAVFLGTTKGIFFRPKIERTNN